MTIKELMLKAYREATKSPDPSNQTGALIYDDHKIFGPGIVSLGHNDFPPGTEYTPELLKDRTWKLFHIEHAERNAIFNMIKDQIKVENPIMICPWIACADCSRAIILSGIKKVICHQERMDLTPDRWRESITQGLKMIERAGVEIEYWSGKIGGTKILVEGQLWTP